ncbi:uncharacterized protein LOC133678002 [Populus nigra]|uniref:uncharacterized protein LOC133678002 n=1 Tax=Populus nigra TaxID=3691 RepID=UPI002B276A4B|nr:uncharacterized protein LOC133678002 [Populus nigra]
MPHHLTFTTEGFRSWKRVNDGVRYALLMHVGSPTSPHNNAVKSAEDLMKVRRHIDKVLNAQTAEEVQKNQLRLMTTIESVRWLSLQACAFRGYDESSASNNRGNFLEMIRLMGRLNIDIDDVVLEKALRNAKSKAIEIAHMVATGERETGRRANQIGNLHRSGTTRWNSHFDSICSLIDMYGAIITVLESMVQEGSSNSIRGEAGGCLIQKSLDILNAMDLVLTTKALLQTLRDAGFDLLLANVQFVCTKYEIDIPHMNASYKKATGRSCKQQGSMTVYQYYHYDIFNSTIDFQLEELNSRFSDETMELLVLSSSLEPKDNFKSFKVDAIYKLAKKFYPEDFNEQEMYYLRFQLEHYQIDENNKQKG